MYVVLTKYTRVFSISIINNVSTFKRRLNLKFRSERNAKFSIHYEKVNNQIYKSNTICYHLTISKHQYLRRFCFCQVKEKLNNWQQLECIGYIKVIHNWNEDKDLAQVVSILKTALIKILTSMCKFKKN